MFPRFSETFILAELLELERQGVRIRIFSLRPPQDTETHADLTRLRATVDYVPLPTWKAWRSLSGAHLGVLARHPVRYLAAAWRVVRRRRRDSAKHFVQAAWVAARLEGAGISHVHAHFASSATSVAIHLNRLTGPSYSFTAHAKDIYLDTVSSNDLARKLAGARFAVTVSDYNARHLAPLDRRGRLVRIYNGLDLAQFAARERRPELPPLVLAVGRLVEKKGFDDLIRACAVLKGRGVAFRCAIVGSGGERDGLASMIEELDLTDRVELAGPMPRERLIELLPRASAFAAPCVVAADGNRDGLPTVLVEAMALGVPVVASDVTGIPELVRHGETGLIVPQRDPTALALAIQTLVTDDAFAARLATAGRRLVEEKFDLRRNVAVLRRLLVGARVAPRRATEARQELPA
jgi:glycosyltransferase involved in cell wall biosynthesis